MAVYTRNTLAAISRHTKQKFVVLVEEQYGRQPELLAKGSILLLPCFKAQPLQVFTQLSTALRQFDQIDNIQLHSEFYHSGQLLQMLGLLPFLYYWRLQGKIISFVAHNVVHDFAFLRSLVGHEQPGWLLNLLSRLVPWYYRLLALGVEQFITLDESIRQRLSSYLWQSDKVVGTHIWLRKKRASVTARQAMRRRLGLAQSDMVLAVFGFMSRYKGVDVLVQNFLRFKREFPQSRVKLLLAGGPAPSQQDKVSYQRFYRRLKRLASAHPDIILTGFIPEQDLAGYMATTDVVLLPYQGILGASASWSMVLEYARPCFFSTALEPYLQATDVNSALQAAKLQSSKFLFALDYPALHALFLKLSTNQALIKQASAFSRLLRTLRSEESSVFRDFPPLYFPRAAAQRVTVERTTTKAAAACYNVTDEEIVA